MEMDRSDISFPKMCASEVLRLKESEFLCQGQQYWKCVGKALTIGVGEWNGVTFHSGHIAE